MLKNGSCATRGREPCQVGNQAALSGLSGVPQGCLPGADRTVNVCKGISKEGCIVLSDASKFISISLALAPFIFADVVGRGEE